MTDNNVWKSLYEDAVNAAMVFQCGGPLAYLMRPGESTLLVGPGKAAAEIARLRAANAKLVEALKDARPYVPDHHGPVVYRIDAALREAEGNG